MEGFFENIKSFSWFFLGLETTQCTATSYFPISNFSMERFGDFLRRASTSPVRSHHRFDFLPLGYSPPSPR